MYILQVNICTSKVLHQVWEDTWPSWSPRCCHLLVMSGTVSRFGTTCSGPQWAPFGCSCKWLIPGTKQRYNTNAITNCKPMAVESRHICSLTASSLIEKRLIFPAYTVVKCWLQNNINDEHFGYEPHSFDPAPQRCINLLTSSLCNLNQPPAFPVGVAKVRKPGGRVAAGADPRDRAERPPSHSGGHSWGRGGRHCHWWHLPLIWTMLSLW